jgi:hypothetical protein
MGKPYAGRSRDQVIAKITASIRILDSGCWEWTGTLTAQGYASLRWLGLLGGHRVSYAAHVGPIPPGLHVCHECDYRPCVNPAHLFIGTAADNNADMDAKGRSNRVGFAPETSYRTPRKLTDGDIRAILASADRGVDLARRYSVSQQTICNVRKGRRSRGLAPV